MELPIAPWIIVLMVLFIVVIAILAYLKAASLIYSDTSKASSYSLHAMLGSNECAPKTKLPFKDVLALGIAQGKSTITDRIILSYAGTEETVTFPKGNVGKYLYTDYCMKIFREKNILPQSYLFYVDYANKRYFEEQGVPTMAESVFNVVSKEYIALPNGGVAEAVLKTKS